MNRSFLTGNLCSDPEVKRTGNGVSFVRVTVANTRRWKDANGGQQEKTAFVPTSFWGKQADWLIEQGARKGSSIMVTGELETSSSESNDGKRQTFWGIRALEFHLLNVSRTNRSQAASTAQPAQPAPAQAAPAQPSQAPASEPEPEGWGDDQDVPF